jgi:hypothetical protein
MANIIYDNVEDESSEPDKGAVFTMTNGEQIRIDYCNIFLYRSTKNGSQTVLELGYSPNTETIMLNLPFSKFDQMVQDNKEAWEDYYESKGSLNSFY